MTLVFTGMLIWVYWKGNVCENKETFQLSSGFEVTPVKLCEGGEYMHQSEPKKSQCEQLLSTPEGQEEYHEYNCTDPVFNGRPVHFEYTPLSNDMWENERCDGSLVDTPRVL